MSASDRRYTAKFRRTNLHTSVVFFVVLRLGGAAVLSCSNSSKIVCLFLLSVLHGLVAFSPKLMKGVSKRAVCVDEKRKR